MDFPKAETPFYVASLLGQLPVFLHSSRVKCDKEGSRLKFAGETSIMLTTNNIVEGCRRAGYSLFFIISGNSQDTPPLLPKEALTLRSLSIITVQASIPLQPPSDQLPNTDPFVGAAFKVTVIPFL